MSRIMKYEMDKVLKNKTFMGALVVSLFVLAGILFIGFHYSQVNTKNGEGMALYHKVVAEGTGELSDQKVKGILADYIDRFQSTDAEKRTFDLFSWEIADTFFPNDVAVYQKMNDAIKQHDKVTIDQLNLKTIKEVGFTQFQTPLKLGSYVTWHDLFKVTGQLFILTSMITILICSLVFSEDRSRNMNQLLLTTKFGRNKLSFAKITTATLIPVCVFIAIQAISLVVFYVYNSGFNGWDTSIQTNFSLKQFDFPVEINQLQAFSIMLVLHFISLLSIAGITTYVSSITRSPFSALAISLGLFFLPKALTELFKRGIVYKLLNLFPINNYRMEDLLSIMRSKHDYLFAYFVQNIVLTMIALLVVKVILDGVVYLRMKKYQVT